MKFAILCLALLPKLFDFQCSMHENETYNASSRKLSTIAFVDIMGYTSMMHGDEQFALNLLNLFNKIL